MTSGIGARKHIVYGIVSIGRDVIGGISDTHNIANLVITQLGTVAQSICLLRNTIVGIVLIACGIATAICGRCDVAITVVTETLCITSSIHDRSRCTIVVICCLRHVAVGIGSGQLPSALVISERVGETFWSANAGQVAFGIV